MRTQVCLTSARRGFNQRKNAAGGATRFGVFTYTRRVRVLRVRFEMEMNPLSAGAPICGQARTYIDMPTTSDESIKPVSLGPRKGLCPTRPSACLSDHPLQYLISVVAVVRVAPNLQHDEI